MRIWIQTNKKGIPLTPNNYAAYYGARKLGYEIKLFSEFQELINGHDKSDLVSSGVPVIRDLLKILYNINLEEINYPEELKHFYHRNFWKSTINAVRDDQNSWPIFIKSVEGKRLTGKVIRQISDLVGCGCSEENYEILCSDVLNIESEYRVFVRYGQILGVKHYAGNPYLKLDKNIVENCIYNKYKNIPWGCAVDFGILDTGETIVIEVNDGYALGTYGLDPVYYIKLMSARWAQITGTQDYNDYF